MATESDSHNAPERSAPRDATSQKPTAASASAEHKGVSNAESTATDSSSRKRNFDTHRGRGRGRGGGRGGRGRGGRGGKNEYTRRDASEQGGDKRERHNEWRDRKRQKVDENGRRVVPTADGEQSYMSIQFSKDEIDAEERRPKRKVAVMIGYAGTGYHGLQINHKEKTIEGDLFGAFIAANAISKVNADDPRKSSLVRTARTDKGVHAAGNVLSLKLIIEDPDVVKKINDALPPQIRVWGIQRTNNSFSCYQSCDSRWYEYLMPSYCLLPPHPESFLGKNVLESVKENGAEEAYAKRMADVAGFWEEVEKNEIQPIIDSLDPDVRERVLRKRHAAESESKGSKIIKIVEPADEAVEGTPSDVAANTEAPVKEDDSKDSAPTADVAMGNSEPLEPKQPNPVDVALKQIKAAYVAAKRRYRITPERLNQLQEALNEYLGTRNYHNYTVEKKASDPSAKRNIKSFVVNPEPIQIKDTQWLSLKVHGQSFMMHQIRKMVGMAVLVTRCATDLERIQQSYRDDRISIPKAPSLGLLLERPVFDNYNLKAKDSFERPAIDFGNYEKEIQQFKDEHIYQRIFDLEEKENSFHTFFHQIDNFKSDYFLWVTAGGIKAAHQRVGQADDMPESMKEELGEENDPVDPEAAED